jgi:hypothetical protein
MFKQLTDDLLDLTAKEVGHRRAGAALTLSACCCSCCCDCIFLCSIW